jgi:hypothetical protein
MSTPKSMMDNTNEGVINAEWPRWHLPESQSAGIRVRIEAIHAGQTTQGIKVLCMSQIKI